MVDFKATIALALAFSLIIFAAILDQILTWLGGVSFLIGDVAALIVAFLIIFIPLMCLFMFLSVLAARKG